MTQTPTPSRHAPEAIAATYQRAVQQLAARASGQHVMERREANLFFHEAMASHPQRAEILHLIEQSDEVDELNAILRNSVEHRIEMVLSFAERRIMDEDREWLLRRYRDSITVAAAMLFGEDTVRFSAFDITYDDLSSVAGPTPIAQAHWSIFEAAGGREDEDAPYFNFARVIMAVHDAIRMLGPGSPVSLMDPDGTYDRAVYTHFIITQGEGRARITAPDCPDDEIGPIAVDELHDLDLRSYIYPIPLENAREFELGDQPHDFDSIIASRLGWNEPDDQTDGSTDRLIQTRLDGGMLIIENPRRQERLDYVIFTEGRTADPRATDQPQTWSWVGHFEGKLEKPGIPLLESEAALDIALVGLAGGYIGIHGEGFVSINPDGTFSGWFEEPPIFAEAE